MARKRMFKSYQIFRMFTFRELKLEDKTEI